MSNRRRKFSKDLPPGYTGPTRIVSRGLRRVPESELSQVFDGEPGAFVEVEEFVEVPDLPGAAPGTRDWPAEALAAYWRLRGRPGRPDDPGRPTAEAVAEALVPPTAARYLYDVLGPYTTWATQVEADGYPEPDVTGPPGPDL
jgi:hypothetical protein